MKTLKFISFLLLMFNAIFSLAQTPRTVYTYDAAGNRVKREVIVFYSRLANSNSNPDTVSSTKPLTEIIGKMEITIFPNPTKGQLSLEIANMPVNAIGEIRIYNVAGNIIQYQKTIGSLNQFDFSPYSTGIYFLDIKVGQTESKWKIIKQ